jgi:hypothetical protein
MDIHVLIKKELQANRFLPIPYDQILNSRSHREPAHRPAIIWELPFQFTHLDSISLMRVKSSCISCNKYLKKMKIGRKMMKIATGLISVFFCLLCASSLFAETEYSIHPWWIQKRVYENGQEYNRLAFGIHKGGAPIQPGGSNPVAKVIITDPNQNEVTIIKEFFEVYETINGRFDRCNFDYFYQPWTLESYYVVNFLETPTSGTYMLEVETTDGAILTDNLIFNGLFELPQISSKSFRGGKDSNGNLFYLWDPPSDPEFLGSDTINIDVRAFLEAYDSKGNFVADVFVTNIPVNFGYVRIPSDIVQLFEPKGASYKFGLQIRTTDNNNRYYPTSMPLDRIPEKRKAGVVVVPMN